MKEQAPANSDFTLKWFLDKHAKMTLQILNSLLARDNPEVFYAVSLQSFHYPYKLRL